MQNQGVQLRLHICGRVDDDDDAGIFFAPRDITGDRVDVGKIDLQILEGNIEAFREIGGVECFLNFLGDLRVVVIEIDAELALDSFREDALEQPGRSCG
ncbi:MAG: hypothetical protein AAGF67_17375 [Verrucomicrobiota bacterium]